MNTYEKAIATYGKESQLRMCIEEMAELQKEICKYLRGSNNLAHVAEETADVEIMITQLKMMLNINLEVLDIKAKKLERLEDRIKSAEPKQKAEDPHAAHDAESKAGSKLSIRARVKQGKARRKQRKLFPAQRD